MDEELPHEMEQPGQPQGMMGQPMQAPPPMPQQKPSGLTKIIAGIVLVLFFAFVLYLAYNNYTSKPQPNTTNTTATTSVATSVSTRTIQTTLPPAPVSNSVFNNGNSSASPPTVPP